MVQPGSASGGEDCRNADAGKGERRGSQSGWLIQSRGAQAGLSNSSAALLRFIDFTRGDSVLLGMNEPTEVSDVYISKSELARRMGVTTRTIETWMRQSKIPFAKIGRTVRFHWGDVQHRLASRQQAVVDQPLCALKPDSATPRLKELASVIRARRRKQCLSPTKP